MILKMNLIIVSFLVTGISCHYVCHRGQYLNRTTLRRCLPCQEGTYMIEDNHTNINCHPCSQTRSYRHEITVKNCTRTSNTVIGCRKNYFLDYVSKDCAICTDCEKRHLVIARKCDEGSDTVCCPKPGMTLNGITCVETSPFVCHRGQRLEYDTSGQPSCIDCRPGFFRSQDNHQYVECVECTTPNPTRHETLVKECTATHDTIIGCAQDYFSKDGKCRRCRICMKRKQAKKYTVRVCSETGDTVCCPWAGMFISPKNGWNYCMFGHRTVIPIDRFQKR